MYFQTWKTETSEGVSRHGLVIKALLGTHLCVFRSLSLVWVRKLQVSVSSLLPRDFAYHNNVAYQRKASVIQFLHCKSKSVGNEKPKNKKCEKIDKHSVELAMTSFWNNLPNFRYVLSVKVSSLDRGLHLMKSSRSFNLVSALEVTVSTLSLLETTVIIRN